MRMWFSHAHALFYTNARGLRERTEFRRRFGEDGVDQEETEERDVWIRRELVNRKREEAEAEVDEKAEIDSIDSLICACGSPMLMTFPHAHDVLLCEREGIA
jgi:hypothetical protein